MKHHEFDFCEYQPRVVVDDSFKWIALRLPKQS